MQRLLDRHGCPGVLVAVVPQDGEASVYAVGHANAARSAPMDRALRMRIGSVSKLFVGAALLRCVDDGVVSLDARVSNYLPGVPGGDQITLRMLGKHTSGLPDPIRSPRFRVEVMKTPARFWKPSEVLQFCYRLRPVSNPGEQVRYSNVGAVLLAEALAAAAEKSFAELMKETVLTPLGLRDTGYCSAAAPPGPTCSAYRFARRGEWLSYGRYFTEVTGHSASWSSWAGDMYSTIHDLSKAAPQLLTGRLLSDRGRRELFDWRQGSDSVTRHGILIKQTTLGIGHDGDVPGFSAAVWRSPREGQCVIVLANLCTTTTGDSPANRVAEYLLSATAEAESPTLPGKQAGLGNQ
ncbi:MAG: serine hydrolase domain-containing protein [Planctomycetota bacterium]